MGIVGTISKAFTNTVLRVMHTCTSTSVKSHRSMRYLYTCICAKNLERAVQQQTVLVEKQSIRSISIFFKLLIV